MVQTKARRWLCALVCVALVNARPRPLASSIARSDSKPHSSSESATVAVEASLVTENAAPLAVRGGASKKTAATDGALFLGSFLYILAVIICYLESLS
jgi:hypothetical protein